jgi:inosine/xanthosine triphosphatase
MKEIIINVASMNAAKVNAVDETVRRYEFLKDATVRGVEVNTGVSDQPKSLEETINGAINRATGAFKDCTYSFGIESGLMQVPRTKSGIMDVCVCAIYDGKEYHIGLSSAFEPPKQMAQLMLEDGLDMSEACVKMGMTDNPKIGAAEGAIGILTHGRMTRKDYTVQALLTALIHLENTELF